jgi:hypothetical protein
MRLLILADDPAAETNLHEPLEEIAGGEELEVKVVAPLRPESTLDLATGDIDDADPLLAIGDALAEFEAEHVVLVDPDDEELATAVRERYTLPVTELSAG